MDWATLIVGIITFLGVLISLFTSWRMSKKANKEEKEKIDDKYSREIITNSRKEWLKDMKSTLAEFFACTSNVNSILFDQDTNTFIKVDQLYYKLILNLNPIGKIDGIIREMLKVYFDMYKLVLSDSQERESAEKDLLDYTDDLESYFTYYFKTEWMRIQDYAKHGEKSNFDFEKQFFDLRKKGEDIIVKDKKEKTL